MEPDAKSPGPHFAQLVSRLANHRFIIKTFKVTTTTYDVLVIGCGPGGSSAATFLARAGRRVLVLEREVFPRFHIGESLLPCNMTIFRELGVLPALQAAGFPRKFGAQFELGNASIGTSFVFRQGRFNREPEAIQVERATFDHILLKHTRAAGADVREGWTVKTFTADAEGITVEAADPEGTIHSFRAGYLIDASGRGNVTGNQEKLRELHPNWRKIAIFGHFEKVWRSAGDSANDTVIIRLENAWFWLIPVSATKTSVGLVIDKDVLVQSGESPAEFFRRWTAANPAIRQRMENAQLLTSLQTTTDFSYCNRKFTGRRLLRVGDAAGFLDPIFSAGVFLAMWSGKIAAETLDKSLAQGQPSRRLFARYEKRVRKGLTFYWQVVEAYYTTPFMELFLQPRPHHDLPSAVNAVLAGELEGGWRLRWRLKYFFLLVKIQKHWPLVPRISFAPRKRKPVKVAPVAVKS